MLLAQAQVVITNKPTDDVFLPTPVTPSISEQLLEQAIHCNPPRNRRLPDRLTY